MNTQTRYKHLNQSMNLEILISYCNPHKAGTHALGVVVLQEAPDGLDSLLERQPQTAGCGCCLGGCCSSSSSTQSLSSSLLSESLLSELDESSPQSLLSLSGVCSFLAFALGLDASTLRFDVLGAVCAEMPRFLTPRLKWIT